MNTVQKILKNKYTLVILTLIVGIFIGWLIKPSDNRKESAEAHRHSVDTADAVWTCSMHPQIRQSGPGQCPICGMDLIPLSTSSDEGNSGVVSLSPTAARLANVQTITLGSGEAIKSLRLNGKVVPNERLIKTQSAHISGRVEQLYINTTGESVRQGQRLATLYSPELITAQHELLQGVAIKETQSALYEAAKAKLRALKISEAQIQQIEQGGEVLENITIYADRSGIVLNKMVNVGDYLSKGSALFTIGDLSQVWIVFDAYESELPFIKNGNPLTFTIPSQPGEEFTGKVTFIDPMLDPQSRTAKVRVEASNPGQKLKPGMFATALLEAQYGEGQKLVAPKSAVMWTGERSIVYVEVPEANQPTYELREVRLGPRLGNGYVILEGLTAGEKVVVNGTFTIDAAAQLAGKASMMNPEVPTKTENLVAGKPDFSAELPPEFEAQLNALVDDYLILKDALVKDNANQAKKAVTAMEKSLFAVNGQILSGKAHDFWLQQQANMTRYIKRLTKDSEIEAIRSDFTFFSHELILTVRAFGTGKTLYILYCPMGNADQGAYWLSHEDKVLNPYFGQAMLTCGEVRDELN